MKYIFKHQQGRKKRVMGRTAALGKTEIENVRFGWRKKRRDEEKKKRKKRE